MRSLLPRTLAGVLLVLPAPLAAQYRTTPGDTLRYAERTDGRVTMRTPAGAVEVRTSHDAQIGVTFLRDGEAAAWYERLAVRNVGPGGTREPDTRNVLGHPFLLSITPGGAVETRGTPTFPGDLAAITDLSHQFDDFFVSVPSGEPRLGQTWVDTVVSTGAGEPGKSRRWRSIRTFRVERDTVVAGTAALILAVRQTTEIESSAPLAGQPGRATSWLRGTEEGTAVFSPARGRLLSRVRTGSLSGTVTIERGTMPVSLSQKLTYTSTLTLLP